MLAIRYRSWWRPTNRNLPIRVAPAGEYLSSDCFIAPFHSANSLNLVVASTSPGLTPQNRHLEETHNIKFS